MATGMSIPGSGRDLEKAALRGEPSYVWRAGQERRLRMILEAGGDRLQGIVLENGCGVGMYVQQLSQYADQVTGLEYDFQRAGDAHRSSQHIVNAAGEALPFPDKLFDFILSHEVLEHVQDDRKAVEEMVRVLRPTGRMAIFTPNRGYPFETHGVYWRGRYHFGNILFVNYLPRRTRDHLAQHVRISSQKDLADLFVDLPVKFVQQTIIYGAYDNIIARWPAVGQPMRSILQWLEITPLRILGLSHFWVVEKTGAA